MKTFLRVFLIILVLAILVVGGFLIYINLRPSNERNPLTVIPKDAIFVIETSNLTQAWDAIADSKIWDHLMQTKTFSSINKDMEDINAFLGKNKAMGVLFKDRKLFLSAHMLGGNEFDFLFVADIRRASEATAIIKKSLRLIPEFTTSEREYKGTEILELIDIKTKEKISLAIIDNLMVGSYAPTILENAIDQKNEKYWIKNQLFTKTTKELGGKHLIRFYFNYKMLDRFAKVFLTESNDVIDLINKSLGYSALNVMLENEMLSLTGYTSADSVPSYISALSQVGPGDTRADQIVSDQTAFFMSVGFDDFDDFVDKLKGEFALKNTDDFKEYSKNMDLVQGFYKTDLKKTFLSWVGDEIAVAKMRPIANTRMEDMIICIQARDVKLAKESMKELSEKISSRPPFRVKLKPYRDFEISELKVKSFYKIFLGKLFEGMEIPYYTFVKDYLVLSNSETNLESFLDDFSFGRVLANKKSYKDFKDKFETKSNLSIFVQMPKMYSNLYYYSTPESKVKVKESKDVISSFSLIGFQMVSNGKGLISTTLSAFHDTTATFEDELEFIEKSSTDQLLFSNFDSLTFKVKLSADSLKKDGQFTIYFLNSEGQKTDTIKAEGFVTNKNVQGLCRQYYKNGQLYCTSNYKNGKLNGEATFFYNKIESPKRLIMEFEDDTPTGIYIEQWENGNKKAVLELKKGKLDGKAQFFHENGVLKIEGKYKKSVPEGKWIYYNDKGEELNFEKWRKGNKKKTKDVISK